MQGEWPRVQVIAEKMMEYLRTVTDDSQKLDAVTRIHELAERFAPDTQWFLDIMNQVPAATLNMQHDVSTSCTGGHHL